MSYSTANIKDWPMFWASPFVFINIDDHTSHDDGGSMDNDDDDNMGSDDGSMDNDDTNHDSHRHKNHRDDMAYLCPCVRPYRLQFQGHHPCVRPYRLQFQGRHPCVRP